MPSDRPKTKSAMRTWLAKEAFKAAGHKVPKATARAATRPRLWLHYMFALDMLSQALGISIDQAAHNVEFRMYRFDHGHKRALVHHSKYPQRALRDGTRQAVCPVCGSVLDLDSKTWTPNPEAEALEPLDLDGQSQADSQE